MRYFAFGLAITGLILGCGSSNATVGGEGGSDGASTDGGGGGDSTTGGDSTADAPRFDAPGSDAPSGDAHGTDSGQGGDAPGSDSAPPPDSGGPPPDAGADGDTTFACGQSMKCDATMQFCYEIQIGPVGLDGGTVQGNCVPLPQPCLAMPTCACVEMHTPVCGGPGAMETCSMSANGGVIILCTTGV